jgi:hypothetical protein
MLINHGRQTVYNLNFVHAANLNAQNSGTKFLS